MTATAQTESGASGLRGLLRIATAGWRGRVLRLLLALLPLLWLSGRMRWGTVAERAMQVGPRGLALALSAALASLATGALRWRVMLRAYGAAPAATPSYLTLFRYNLVGLYFGVLPTGMAGEAVRGYRVARCLPHPSLGYVLVFMERIAGLLGLLAIATLGAAGSPLARSGPIAAAFDIAIGLGLALGLPTFVLPLVLARAPGLGAYIARVPVLGPMLARLPAPAHPTALISVLALSVLSQGFATATIAALIMPLAPAATLAVCARIVPAIILATYVPLTPGGLGQREYAFVQFFRLVGVESAAATAASLLTFAVGLVLAFVGGLVLLYERARGLE